MAYLDFELKEEIFTKQFWEIERLRTHWTIDTVTLLRFDRFCKFEVLKIHKKISWMSLKKFAIFMALNNFCLFTEKLGGYDFFSRYLKHVTQHTNLYCESHGCVPIV